MLRAKVSVFVELWSKTRQLESQADAHRQLKNLLGAVVEAVSVLRTGGEPKQALELLERARP